MLIERGFVDLQIRSSHEDARARDESNNRMVRRLARNSALLACKITNVCFQKHAVASGEFVKASMLPVYAHDAVVLGKQAAGCFKADPAADARDDDCTLTASRIHLATMIARTLSMIGFGVS